MNITHLGNEIPSEGARYDSTLLYTSMGIDDDISPLSKKIRLHVIDCEGFIGKTRLAFGSEPEGSTMLITKCVYPDNSVCCFVFYLFSKQNKKHCDYISEITEKDYLSFSVE